jgi:flagellar biosynthesis/type III secretory pathway chaperone
MQAVVEQVFPPDIENYIFILDESMSRNYKSEREEKVKYFSKTIKELLDRILSLNEKANFLLAEEQQFLNSAKKIFQRPKIHRNGIDFETFILFIRQGMDSIIARASHTKKKLMKRKQEGENLTKLDHEYIFIFDNLEDLLQTHLRILNEVNVENLSPTDKEKIRTVSKLINYYSDVVRSVAFKEYSIVEDLKTSVLDLYTEDYLKVDPRKKITV